MASTSNEPLSVKQFTYLKKVNDRTMSERSRDGQTEKPLIKRGFLVLVEGKPVLTDTGKEALRVRAEQEASKARVSGTTYRY